MQTKYTPPQRNRLDEPRNLNMDALPGTIYRIQADLVILTDWLARSRNPDLTDRAILDLAVLHANLGDVLDLEFTPRSQIHTD